MVSDLGWLSLGSRRADQHWVLSFAVVCFGGFHYHVGGVWASVRSRVGTRVQSVSRRQCKRFKGRLSMPLEWLFVFASTLRTFSSRFPVLKFSRGFGLRVKFTLVLIVSLPWIVKASSSSSFSSPVLGDYRRCGGSRVIRRRFIAFGLCSLPSITKIRLSSSGGVQDNWVQVGSISGSTEAAARFTRSWIF